MLQLLGLTPCETVTGRVGIRFVHETDALQPGEYPVVGDMAEGGPAASSGEILHGDRIMKVDQTDCDGIDLNELVEILAGPPNSIVDPSPSSLAKGGPA